MLEGIFRGNRAYFGRRKYLNWIFIFEIVLDLFKRVFATPVMPGCLQKI